MNFYIFKQLLWWHKDMGTVAASRYSCSLSLIIQGCCQIQKEVSRGHSWLINVDEIKASGTNQILFLQPNDFWKLFAG